MTPPSSSRTGRADLHLHTPGSDGLITVDEWRQAAARRGIDIIAITDHDHLATVREWCRAGNQIPDDDPGSTVSVIPGIELTARGRIVHVNVLFGGVIPGNVPQAGTPLSDIIRWARAIPGTVVVLVHPLPLIWRGQLRRLARLGLLPDAIETRYPLVVGKTDSLERAARRLGIATMGSSDAHLHPDHLGVNLTTFPGQTAADLLMAIRHRRTRAHAGHSPRRLPRAVASCQSLSSWLLPLRRIPGVSRLNRALLLRSRLATGLGPFPEPSVPAPELRVPALREAETPASPVAPGTIPG